MRRSRFRLCVFYRVAALSLVLSFGAHFQSAAQQPPVQADSVLILKNDHLLEIFSAGRVIRTYKVALGRGGLAPKQREGDQRTPEGHYIVDARNEHSHFYKALHISYPNAGDLRRAKLGGYPPGGAIMIHGITNGLGWIGPAHRLYDWTSGCIAVTDSEMDQIWSLVPVGTPIEIRP